MHETTEDLDALQAVIDQSYATAGPHLLSIHTPDRRLTAAEVAERLTGMTLLTLATVTADGRPLCGPVDGIFYRAAFYFGSSPESFRARHLAVRPQCSVSHLPGEHLAIIVHGRVDPPRLVADIGEGFADTCVDIYGEVWREWGTKASYWRIEPERMFTFHMEPEASGD